MVRDVRVEGWAHIDRDRVVERRQAIALVLQAAFGLTVSASFSQDAESAKKRRKRKKSEKTKEGRSKHNSSGSGSEVVQVAQKYKGAKYKWGGASPKGFDCSGFTWYVYQKATGMDITRGVEEQWKFGRSVGRGQWQPGDIVFFENTFERGLSHCGIYVNRGKFIHAENEQTGVIISSLDSDYYSQHYAGARRLI
jgi:cell wall-associated NlpC family hydrolase